MIRYGTKTINQEIQIGETEYDITIKVIHNMETPQITMSVKSKSDKNFFNIELTQVDMTEAQVVLNEVANIFRAATGLPMAQIMAPLFPAPAVPVAVPPGYNGSLHNQ